MMFVILNWSCLEDIGVVMEEDGRPQVFESEEEATRYAEEELNFNWEVIAID